MSTERLIWCSHCSEAHDSPACTKGSCRHIKRAQVVAAVHRLRELGWTDDEIYWAFEAEADHP